MSLNERVSIPQIIIMGVLGSTNKVSEADLQQYTLMLLVQELGRLPDKLLLPSEGNSSIYLQEWAEALHIKTQVFHSDWARNGKMAQRIRDDRIQKECTHTLVFLSYRSNRLEKVAESLARKGKIVFTSIDQTLTQLEPVVHAPVPLVSDHARKSGKGTTQTLLKFQTKE